MTHPREGPMGRVRLADLALEVRDEGRGPPALLLHGFPTTNRLWDGVIPALRDAGLRCIAPDLAGHGLSESPGGEPGMERQAGWLTELLDALGGSSSRTACTPVSGRWMGWRASSAGSRATRPGSRRFSLGRCAARGCPRNRSARCSRPTRERKAGCD